MGLGAGLAGCQEETPEEALLSQYKRWDAAFASRDMHELRATVTPESWAWYGECIRLAREASESETKALEASKMKVVVQLRNRARPEVLKTMTPEDYIIWGIDQGIIKTDEANGVAVHSTKIRNDVAMIQMGAIVEKEGKKTRVGRGLIGAASGELTKALSAETTVEVIPNYEYHFKNINGYWYYCEVLSAPSTNAYFQQYADENKMKPWQLIAELEELDHGTLRDSVWSPPKM